MDNLTSWNTTLTQSKTLKSVRGDTRVTYQVTSEGGGGVVSARDFVYGSKSLVSGNKMIIGGLSVTVEEQPEVKGVVRAVHGPGCQMVTDTGHSDNMYLELDSIIRAILLPYDNATKDDFNEKKKMLKESS